VLTGVVGVQLDRLTVKLRRLGVRISLGLVGARGVRIGRRLRLPLRLSLVFERTGLSLARPLRPGACGVGVVFSVILRSVACGAERNRPDAGWE
jgi:hypothetical protein